MGITYLLTLAWLLMFAALIIVTIFYALAWFQCIYVPSSDCIDYNQFSECPVNFYFYLFIYFLSSNNSFQNTVLPSDTSNLTCKFFYTSHDFVHFFV